MFAFSSNTFLSFNICVYLYIFTKNTYNKIIVKIFYIFFYNMSIILIQKNRILNPFKTSM